MHEAVMTAAVIVERLPTPDEYNQLRAAVGWGTYEPSLIEKALPQSLFGVCAYIDVAIVGMARVIGDHGLVYYIQDVIVRPEHQGQGIGTALMDRVMAYIRDHAGHHAIIGLMSAKDKEPFYEKYGFTRRPSQALGSGMTIFWSNHPAA